MRLSQSVFDPDPAVTALIRPFSRIGLFALLAAVLVTASASPPEAAEIAPLNVGNWRGGAYTNDESGAFSHCAASASYRSGITLLFAVTRDQYWSMGFSKSSWSLTRGQKYPVKYQIDGGQILEGTAVARSEKLAQVMLPPEDALFNRFRRGSLLKVEAAKESLEFKLTGTSKMLPALLRCSQQYANEEPGSSNPFVSDGSN